jgi:UDPglucose 6-dehydrogenase
LTQTGQLLGTPQRIVEAVVQVNADRQEQMAQRVITACGGSVKGLRIGVLGVAFKPNTDDVRDAPSLVIIPALQEAGATMAAHDPEAQEEASKHLNDIDWKTSAYDAAQDVDALIILTEWNEYRALDLERIAQVMKTKRIVDMRNIYKPHVMEELGFHYVSIGRSDILPEGTQSLKAVS